MAVKRSMRLDPGRALRWDWEVTESLHCEALTGPWRRLSLDLNWARTDPLAVTLAFPRMGTGPVVWVMCLRLLAEGLTRATGEGDISVRPLGRRWVILEMRPPNNGVVLALPRRSVKRFLGTVEEQIPPDMDTMIDVELRGILTRGANEKGDST